MFHLLLVSAALALGDTDTSPVAHPADLPPADVPARQPEAVPQGEAAPVGRAVLAMPDLGSDAQPEAKAQEQPAAAPPIKIVPETPEEPAAEEPAAAAEPAERWWLMRELQGTTAGYLLDTHRISISGWLAGSYTASQASFSNSPVVWNDRANEFLFQQGWVRIERSIVTDGTTSPSWGFRSDWLFGSDYRMTLPRGLWNSQLLASDIPIADPSRQNLYGVDPITFYVNGYFPNVAKGLEVQVGRIWTPFGVESMEAPSAPLMSRSYAFNWCPPFTHCGIMGTLQVNDQWRVQAGLVNGNDVLIGDPAEEMRFVGTIGWTQANGKNSITFGTSLGRGKFNTGAPFDPNVISLMSESAGRNNINVFDLVWIHTVNTRLSYIFEVMYGYQYGVPTDDITARSGATHNTAHWGSICQYLIYQFNPKMSGVLRFELFDDFDGQRTGYEGLYTAVTAGVQFKPYSWMMFRPEIRYDYNGYTTPFDPDQTNSGTRHGLLTAGADLIVRW